VPRGSSRTAVLSRLVTIAATRRRREAAARGRARARAPHRNL